MITLTVVLFSNGVYIISLNGKKLGFWALNFNVPLPFLLIGLWSILILTMTILSLIAVVKICALLFRVLHLPAIVQRKAA
ncbi:MAG TPA: hypothetical protein VGD98_02505 [Ktedonobacteraceae bacterium]